jgi:DNA polymerase-3 subunit gamma/tau
MADGEPKSGVAEQQLSLSARPKTLDGLVGQERTVRAIRGHIKTGRYPKAWLFYGPKGTGKTTTARIVALSYQCGHQQHFGRPCDACRALAPLGISTGVWGSFPVVEIDGAKMSKKEEMNDALYACQSGIMGDGHYRVYIINEVQQCSDACLAIFLSRLEDTPSSTVFIFTTTAPSELSEAFRSRCQCYEFRELDSDDVEKLVTRLLKRIGSDLGADRLTMALADAKVSSPRLVAQAVEKYAAGCDPDEAATVTGVAELDIMALSKAITHGDWPGASRYLQASVPSNAKELRRLLMRYLRGQLLESPEIGPRADTIAMAITSMTEVANAENDVVFAAICASAYNLASLFSKYTV